MTYFSIFFQTLNAVLKNPQTKMFVTERGLESTK